MELHKELKRISLQDYQVEFDNQSNLVCSSVSEEFCFPLGESPVFLSIQNKGGRSMLVVSEGKISGEVFRRIFTPQKPYSVFRVVDHEGIGIADERNILRVSHRYDLSIEPIAISFDGIDLEIVCAGNFSTGELPWYKKEQKKIT